MLSRRKRQAMLTGQFRAGIVVAFAIMFGVVQLICACMPQANMAEQVTAPMAISSTQSKHTHMPQEPNVASMSGSQQHDHNKHDHQADCSHCDDSAVLTVFLDQAPMGSITVQGHKIIIPAIAEPKMHRADMAATNLSGLRWLNPPRQSPVTLKIRLLT